MNEKLLMKLSNADAIASNEEQVRSIVLKEVEGCYDDILSDGLGSVAFVKTGRGKDKKKIMFTGHMDEVGFMVRHISDIGFVYLIHVGGVIDKSKEMQKVRITTQDGKVVFGLLNVTKSGSGSIEDMYVDIGTESKEETEKLGISIGDMVCFDTECRRLNGTKVWSGKAMDDRTGCYTIAMALKALKDQEVDNDLYFCLTSSEEVGVRGAKTLTSKINPDVVFAIDVANHPELDRGFKNHRKIGKGVMIVHYDKTMSPNLKLLKKVKQIAQDNRIAYQCDMFSGGGTDAGNAHLAFEGKLALVIGIPLRYCHGCVSFVHEEDLNGAVKLVTNLAKTLTNKDLEECISFI